MSTWKMKGEYLKNCNCLATCPCDTEGFPSPHKYCEGIVGMHITEGNFGDVRLDGLYWAGIAHWPGALHEGNGRLQPLIDERANEEQRAAMLEILSGKNGGPLFEILAAVCPTVYPPQFVPFTWEFDKDGRHARLTAGKLLKASSEPLTVPATGEQQRVRVVMPDGFEYREMEVARSTELEASGEISFSYKNTHSSLAQVEHTQAGLAA
ncbi:DUF1326 domain-containing protein [Herbaspirillum sp. ST 5-3]|uniref:DUF1326 domain-containing protein n=1 Tax=Oxalobacteraceae TaxID=75682 RepID=UPI0010A372BB|nr:DUF1326 domain-containing protein [Herbaspirillum sp. ST 5-3]